MKTVLYIEDSRDTQLVMHAYLVSKGYGVLLANNGADALAKFDSKTPLALVILDWMMPVIDGAKFLEYRKTHPGLNKVPVIILTALTDLENVPDVEMVLTKPINWNEFGRALSRYSVG